MVYQCQDDLDILKADIDAAYRRIPIRTKHQRLCYIAFLHKGVLVIAQHLGLPSDAVSSVHDWDRVGMLLCHLLVHMDIVCGTGAFLWSLARRVLKISMKRYVDDLLCWGSTKMHLSGNELLRPACQSMSWGDSDKQEKA